MTSSELRKTLGINWGWI